MRRWSIVIGLSLALACTAGCAGASEDAVSDSDATSATPSASSTADYVTQLNALCRKLMADSLAIGGGAEPTLESYVSMRPEFVELHRAFDEQADSIPVSASEQEAADLFDDFRAWADEAEAKIAEAAETGDPSTFDAAVDAFGVALAGTTWKRDLAAVGISCPAR